MEKIPQNSDKNRLQYGSSMSHQKMSQNIALLLG